MDAIQQRHPETLTTMDVSTLIQSTLHLTRGETNDTETPSSEYASIGRGQRLAQQFLCMVGMDLASAMVICASLVAAGAKRQPVGKNTESKMQASCGWQSYSAI